MNLIFDILHAKYNVNVLMPMRVTRKIDLFFSRIKAELRRIE